MQNGQTLIELVVGLGLIAVVITALAITTTYSLRNTQFSKNQTLATKLAQENMEKVRTIKIANYGVCLQGQPTSACSSWEEIWAHPFTLTGEEYTIIGGCTINGQFKDYCLQYKNLSAPWDLLNGFTGLVIIAGENNGSGGENLNQKRVTSRVFWTDTTGQHSSDLVTVFSKL